jgi:hypothetical protein
LRVAQSQRATTALPETSKSFLVLFFKKELLASFYAATTSCSLRRSSSAAICEGGIGLL